MHLKKATFAVCKATLPLLPRHRIKPNILIWEGVYSALVSYEMTFIVGLQCEPETAARILTESVSVFLNQMIGPLMSYTGLNSARRQKSSTTHLSYQQPVIEMFRSTLFTLALSAFAVMTLAAPNKAKRADDEGSGHDVDDDSVLHLNDIGLVNVDEALKDADVLNDLNILSSEGGN
ncbi:hypothetical protein VTP01DRAFT_6134 [Rhizomucor pusillus]|uniref:uncharacterized protein n=1 Tax=Rhizomucor pusillus TaxID=4840 RepID=UPI003743ADEC